MNYGTIAIATRIHSVIMEVGVKLCYAHAQLGINFTLAYMGINVLAQLRHMIIKFIIRIDAPAVLVRTVISSEPADAPPTIAVRVIV